MDNLYYYLLKVVTHSCVPCTESGCFGGVYKQKTGINMLFCREVITILNHFCKASARIKDYELLLCSSM